ncbi:hypothetical protein [Frankia tisae]|uniref:hypothetical protein n=1 Tax=Frankia tisae TaxID=2950104 RepID=UPI0021C1AAB5|nr:hypothetical protein [Frankia tisae]
MTPAEYARLAGDDEVGRWARAAIAAARRTGPIPQYGSAGWLALPDDDPRRTAAVLIAAEAWRLDSAPAWIRARLTAEFDGAHQAAIAEFEDMWRRTLDHNIGRVDRARAAGGDIGLPIDERVRLARQPREDAA